MTHHIKSTSNSVKETNKYHLFELHELNRDINKTDRLEESMRKHGWIDAYPMHVVRNGSDKMKIKDGHNRFQAAIRLGIPVKYVVCDDSATIWELQRPTCHWTPQHYLQSYVRAGRPAYIAVDRYVNDTGISLGHSISMLAGESAGSNNKMASFKAGTYRLSDPTHANQVKAIVLHMKKCGIKFATNSYFIQALSKVLWIDGFSVSKFKDKISAHAEHFEKQPNVEAYLYLIESIYNRQQRQNKLPVAFLASEASRLRQQAVAVAGKGMLRRWRERETRQGGSHERPA